MTTDQIQRKVPESAETDKPVGAKASGKLSLGAFAVMMKVFLSNYDVKFTGERIRNWHETLSKYPAELVRLALQEHAAWSEDPGVPSLGTIHRLVKRLMEQAAGKGGDEDQKADRQKEPELPGAPSLGLNAG